MKTLAIVGRPNVGKSTLFNRICGKSISIVEDTPGVTRDRIYAQADWRGVEFSVIDTGGIDLKNTEEVQRHITAQAKIAIELADVVLFVADGREGITQGDLDAVEILRKCKKPIIIAVNKLDNEKQESESGYDFYSLGFENVMFISASLGRGIGELLDEIVNSFPVDKKQTKANEDKEAPIRIAVVGKPNAGKSSLINKLLNEERLVVGSTPGTTRDSVDTNVKYHGKEYVLVDTAGIRRKSKIEYESLEGYSVLRSLAAIRRCDVALIVIDASENISDQDLKIASYVNDQGKPHLVVINKWDTIEKDQKVVDEFNSNLKRELAFMSYFKSVYVSAKTGHKVTSLLKLAQEVYDTACTRIKTGTLNEIMHEAFRLSPPANIKGITPKLFYATQAEILPPTFVLFVNNAQAVQNSYKRYLENFIRKSVNFEGVPIKLVLKNRGERDVD